MNLNFVLVLLSISGILFSSEIPQEANLVQTQLSNGVVVWARQQNVPKGMVAFRVVWEQEKVTHTQAIDTLFGDDDEVATFFEMCKETVQGGASHVGVIAVGDFSPEAVLKTVAHHMSDLTLQGPPQQEKQIEIVQSPESSKVNLSLAYPTPRILLREVEDLRKQWLTLFLQAVVQSRMMQLSKSTGGVWVEAADSHFLLPENFCKAKVECQPVNCLDVLGSFLVAVQEIRKGGFTEEEFEAIKGRVQKSLIGGYRRSPDSATLANYYAEQFAFGQGCPAYDFFMQTSLSLIPQFTRRDLHELVVNSLKDEYRHVKLVGPRQLNIDEAKVKKVLDLFQADTFVLALGTVDGEEDVSPTVGGSDPYTRLPITEGEAQIIWEIIDTLAEKSIIQLGFMQGEMKRKGQLVNHVHPLKFLGTIFTNPHLKTCMKEVRTSYLKWTGFLGGLSGRLEQEYKRGNLMSHVPGFCVATHANPDQVAAFLQKKEWEKLVKYLLKLE
jgi:hypothetical protein